MSIDADLERIALQEQELQFDSFSLETGWALGSSAARNGGGAQARRRYRCDAVFHAGVLHGAGRLDARQSELGAPQAQLRLSIPEEQLCCRPVACQARHRYHQQVWSARCGVCAAWRQFPDCRQGHRLHRRGHCFGLAAARRSHHGRRSACHGFSARILAGSSSANESGRTDANGYCRVFRETERMAFRKGAAALAGQGL